MNYYLHVLRNFANFGGRARRSEYWFFVLFNTIFSIIAMVLDSMAGFTYGNESFGVLQTIYALFVFIPALAVAVRRLHDTNKSGWWLLIAIIPLIGAIWLLVLMVTDSEPDSNDYGPNPKETSDAPSGYAPMS